MRDRSRVDARAPELVGAVALLKGSTYHQVLQIFVRGGTAPRSLERRVQVSIVKQVRLLQ